MTTSLRRRADVRVDCPSCTAPYLPRLTGGRCPVCDAAPPDGSGARPPRRIADQDDRLMALVLVGTLANVLLLAGLALLVVRI